MSQSAARAMGAPGTAAASMSIGEVLAHLRADFPDTTISKLRFLESEGLVEPERTASGYRKYSWDDVARLRYVLTAQRDHYLPLRVIRDQLSEWDGGAPAPEPTARDRRLVSVDQLPDFQSTLSDARLSRAEFCERAGIDDATLKDLEQHGLLAARSGGYYDADTLEIARLAAQLAEYGLEPRHLRSYRVAADREVGLFEQVAAPMTRQRGADARARAEDTVRELAALSLRLHATLVHTGLRRIFGGS